MSCDHYRPSELCQGCTWCAYELGQERQLARIAELERLVADQTRGSLEIGYWRARVEKIEDAILEMRTIYAQNRHAQDWADFLEERM